MKRARGGQGRAEEGEDEDEDALLAALAAAAPCDTLAAAQLLLRRAAPAAVTDPAVTFSHHLYSEVRHRSTVDRELHECVESGQLRLLYVNTGPADRAVVQEADYAALATRLAADQRAAGKPAVANLVEQFRDRVLPACKDLSISVPDLKQLLAQPPDAKATALSRTKAAALVKAGPGPLCDVGLLIRRVDVFQANSYWFTLPGLGEAVGLLKTARREIVATIKRRRNNEMLQRELVLQANGSGKDSKRRRTGTAGAPGGQRRKPGASIFGEPKPQQSAGGGDKLAQSVQRMGVDYHIMDAVQSGTVLAIPTGMGPLLKLPNAS